ncbi:protein containing Peptidase M16C associated domain protein, partial [gut metagenome]
VLGYVDTERFTYGELFNEINASTGGIQCGVEVFEKAASTGEFQAMFSIRGKALYQKLEFLFDMMEEILNTSKVEDTRRLYEIIAQVKSRAQANLVSAGHSTAVLRGASYDSPMAYFQDQMSGIGYYQFIEAAEREFEEKKDQIVGNLKRLLREILSKDSFCISYTGEKESLSKVQQLSSKLKNCMKGEGCKGE